MTAPDPSPPSLDSPLSPRSPHRPAVPPGDVARIATVAGVATLCAATSLTSVLQGGIWFGYVLAATVLAGCTGLFLRSLRLPPLVVGVAQLLALFLFVTGAFTASGILAVIPGPAAFAELNTVLTEASEQIRTGLAPVEATKPLLCLLTIAIGFAAILVDTFAVSVAAPAVAGLVLLCIYAVPSALSGELLPWWTFALGAAAFAWLLTVTGRHRDRNQHLPVASAATPRHASLPIVVIALSLIVGLVTGATVTRVGTEGTLPGHASEGNTDGHSVPAGLGIDPFTSLRGMLDQSTEIELFRVQGLQDDRRLLRAFTLDTYRPNKGWSLAAGPMPAGLPADGPLPRTLGNRGADREIHIAPIRWNDVWLPVYGTPRGLHGISAAWRYDHTSGTVFREHPHRPDPYVEIASLHQPTKAELQQTGRGADEVPPIYTDASGVDPRVAALAQQLTRNKTNDFDRTEAIWRHFSISNGFVYDTETAPASDHDAVADFLFQSKRGFCEQFASSMAVMLRSVGIPSRVAVGFTAGRPTGDYRTITSQDAHAWVEVYFGGLGWMTFDPTPLSDGRGIVPPYLHAEDTADEPATQSEDAGSPMPDDEPQQVDRASGPPTTPNDNPTGQPFHQSPSGRAALVATLAALALTVAAGIRRWPASTTAAPHSNRRSGLSWLPTIAGALWLTALVLLGWRLHWAVSLGILVLALLIATPSVARQVQRQCRLADITAGRPNAARRAWEELLAECTDRGTDLTGGQTARSAARKIAQRHRLDRPGETDLHTLISILERSWYSRDGNSDADRTELARAFRGVQNSLRRNTPLSWRARLLPRSLLRFRHTERSSGPGRLRGTAGEVFIPER